MSIKKGDLVKVISGNNKIKEKIGLVLKVFPKKKKIVIDNINIYKRHLKKKNNTEEKSSIKSGIIEKNMPIHISKVMLFNKELNRPFRIDYKIKKKILI